VSIKEIAEYFVFILILGLTKFYLREGAILAHSPFWAIRKIAYGKSCPLRFSGKGGATDLHYVPPVPGKLKITRSAVNPI
jgi:hypothetical protein